MQLKHLIFAITLASAHAASLLRKPKVYNALITTNENLTPSRAYPVIQPVLQETGVAFSSFSSPYAQTLPALRFFNPYNNYQEAAYGLVPAEVPQHRIVAPAAPTTTDSPASPEQVSQAAKSEQEAPPAPIPKTEVTPPAEQQEPQPTIAPLPPQGKPQEKPKEKSPIPLNEFGYPPSLFPVSPYQPSFQTYPYGFPMIFDPTYQSSIYPVLPPFGAYPSAGGAVFPQSVEPKHVSEDQSNQINANPSTYADYAEQFGPFSYEPQRVEPQPERQEAPPQHQQPLYTGFDQSDHIKNYQNKNKDIPDVPIPPLPTSRNAKN